MRLTVGGPLNCFVGMPLFVCASVRLCADVLWLGCGVVAGFL